MKSERILYLQNEILYNQKKYREGSPEISDPEFDSLVEELRSLNPNDPLLTDIHGEILYGTKCAITYPMGSLTNIKTEEDLHKFIGPDLNYVVTPKYDGISCQKEWNEDKTKYRAVSRGNDGVEGTNITNYFDLIGNRVDYLKHYDTRGELVISRKNFIKLNELRESLGMTPYKTERSAIIGLFQSLELPKEFLPFVEYKPYHLYNCHFDKVLQLVTINNYFVKVPYLLIHGSKINHNILRDFFDESSKEYEIDGLVIEVNDNSIRERLGNETNSLNPKYARAYKNGFEEEKDTVIVNIERKINKSGEYTPVLHIEPVELCGNTVSKINVDNERFLLWYGVGIGTTVTVKKSGNVIPRLTKVSDVEILPFKEFNKKVKHYGTKNIHEFQAYYGLPNGYSEPSFPYKWSDNNVDILSVEESKGQKIRRILFFFKTLRIMDVGESVISQLYHAGYDSIEKIILANPNELLHLEGFGKKKVENLQKEINEKLSISSFTQIMHSSGYFDKVGDTKLSLIGITGEDWILPNISELREINGVGDYVASIVYNNYHEFKEFYDKIKHKIVKNNETGSLSGKIICFTGFRDQNLVNNIIKSGGVYRDSYNKTVNLLVHNNSESGSKVEKAKKDGVEIMSKFDFYKLVQENEIKSNKTETPESFGSLF